MANEPARLPPFEALRVEIQSLRQSALFMLSPKNRATLEMLDAYLVSTEHRLQALEDFGLAAEKAIQELKTCQSPKTNR